MLAHDFLQHSAKQLPCKTALVSDGVRLTYAEIDKMANRLAQAMIDQGLNCGDRVIIYYRNSLEVVVSIFATLKANAVFVVVNPSTKAQKLSYILNNCTATTLLASTKNQASLKKIISETPSIKFVVNLGKPIEEGIIEKKACLDFSAIQARYSASCPLQKSIDLDLACLIYTSGSTGEPKGVMSDHSNVVFAAESVIEYLQNVESDIVLNVLPLSFDYGLYQLLMTFKFGGTLILEQSFAYPASILKLIEKESVTGFPGVPTTFSILLQMDLSAYDLSSLRYLSNTGAALPPNHIAELQKKFPTATIYSMYGLTETKRTLYLPPDQLKIRPGSVGIAIPGTEVWLEDNTGKRLGPGKTGELVVRGRHVMRGYWGNPKDTAIRFRPGPLPGEQVCYTGDLFRTDADGYFYFVCRKDDIIKSRGEKVAPKEIENVAYSLDGIIEAAVVGVPDPILGEAIKLLVVTNNPQTTKAKVLAHCRKHLEDFMVPKYVEFRQTLPKTGSGKINKTEL